MTRHHVTRSIVTLAAALALVVPSSLAAGEGPGFDEGDHQRCAVRKVKGEVLSDVWFEDRL